MLDLAPPRSGALAARSDQRQPFDPDLALNRSFRLSGIIMATLVFGLGTLAATIPISGAVVAPGEVTLASCVKKIAHPRGGVIAAIAVRNGDHVKAGQILMRLDTTVSATSATLATASVDQLTARIARLGAERDGSAMVRFPDALLTRRDNPTVAAAVDEEQRLFMLNRRAREGQKAALMQQIHQNEEAIRGYDIQAAAYGSQGALIAEEETGQEQLWKKGLTTLKRRNELRRAAVGLQGSAAAAQTSAAQLQSRIAELRQQMIVLDQNARSAAGSELSEVQGRLNDLRRQQAETGDTNFRNVIRAPHDGTVGKLAFTTIGGVIPAGETIMEVVPDSDRLIVTARVRPADIDQLSNGQNASLRFSAFNMRTTPQILGRLDVIAADRSTEAQTNSSYYPVEIAIPAEQLQRLGGLKLRSGMPVEAFIRTSDRTLLGYIMKPLSDQLARALREN